MSEGIEIPESVQTLIKSLPKRGDSTFIQTCLSVTMRSKQCMDFYAKQKEMQQEMILEGADSSLIEACTDMAMASIAASAMFDLLLASMLGQPQQDGVYPPMPSEPEGGAESN